MQVVGISRCLRTSVGPNDAPPAVDENNVIAGVTYETVDRSGQKPLVASNVQATQFALDMLGGCHHQAQCVTVERFFDTGDVHYSQQGAIKRVENWGSGARPALDVLAEMLIGMDLNRSSSDDCRPDGIGADNFLIPAAAGGQVDFLSNAAESGLAIELEYGAAPVAKQDESSTLP
ncbi:hypothetical protein PPGU19_093260 (plasmid) [Paraburkholderia sp. PGU19]|nr:hypothetical protein PPGU19_093260 [Paraburkholderia sp. PGU19]BDC45446.1 hypothetical protein PTKU15_87430 [Paraburkholderia terrae]